MTLQDDLSVPAESPNVTSARLNGLASQQPPRFILQPFDKIAIGSQTVYLVKGLIPRSGLIVIYGPPKSGKSFFTYDLAMHIALGWDYRGRRVKQGPVVYCALEGAEGFKARIQAFRQARLAEGAAATPFYLIAASMALAKDHRDLIKSIRASPGDVKPAAVVLDTLNRSIAGSESDDRDMGAYLNAAGAIQDAFGCAVIIVHHSGVDPSRPRGHTSLTGAADAQISLRRDPRGNIVARVEWMKDGPQGDQIVSRLTQVEVGQDEDGDPITSCTIAAVEGVAARERTALGHDLTKGAKIALNALQQAIDDVGEAPPASDHIPSNFKVVSINQWRDHAYQHGISSSDEPRARQLAFQRAHQTLVAKKIVGIWESHVWLL